MVVWYSANSLNYMTLLNNFTGISWLEFRHWCQLVIIDSCRQHRRIWRSMLRTFCKMTILLVTRYVRVQHDPHQLTSLKPLKARFCAQIISSVLTNTVFVKGKHCMTFQPHTMMMFDSLPVNSVLFAVIMIAHCIQKFETRGYEWENFDGLRVLSKFCVDDESKEESY